MNQMVGETHINGKPYYVHPRFDWIKEKDGLMIERAINFWINNRRVLNTNLKR